MSALYIAPWATPSISGTAALVAAQLGTAMVRMALVISRHTNLLIKGLDSILLEIKTRR